MNKVLELKGIFDYKKNLSAFSRPNLRGSKCVTSEHLNNLISELEQISTFWNANNELIQGALVSVHYTEVVAKSNRVKALLINGGSANPNDFIRGAKFEVREGEPKHVFTYFVDMQSLKESVRRLTICEKTLEEHFDGRIDKSDIDNIYENQGFGVVGLSRSNFIQVIIDASFIDRFGIDQDAEEVQEDQIITLYQTGDSSKNILHKLGVEILQAKMLDKNTFLLNKNDVNTIKREAPYLISMQAKDMADYMPDDFEPAADASEGDLPDPINEPVIGVIDTLFDKKVYFNKWVNYSSLIDDEIEVSEEDMFHGTAVSSIIVDGPSLNPELNDGCGRFRVRHFGVALQKGFSVFSILRNIREIVSDNSDIKVWNLSLGSEWEVENNFISPVGAELDRLQNEYDIIFVVAGTNLPKNKHAPYRLGSPADSLNSIVVNSVTRNKQSASYSRVGPVLSFFNKPDVSYYGGDKNEFINVITPKGKKRVAGTSFAAPWIARKMAYLIYKIGLNREIAKALIIDSAAGWNLPNYDPEKIGYGVVPIRIDDIIQSQNDEIRFVMTGTSDAYESYSYKIPVPIRNDKHPYYARATLCYYPKCSRNQGVDYTDTEMDIHFGRVKEVKGGLRIDSLNKNTQGDPDSNGNQEDEARSLFRKWDNIKHIHDTIKNVAMPRKKYGIGNWGLSIKTKHRLSSATDKKMQFGVVITLKEMFGVNRIDEFIKLCNIRGWIVNTIDVKNRVDIYVKAEEDIRFDK